MMKFTSIIFLAGWLISGTAATQDLKEMRAQYPGKDAVFLLYSRQLKLLIQNDSVVAESVQENEMMILTDKNPAIYSPSAVYHSGFNKLSKLEAYTILPSGKKQSVTAIKTESSPGNSVFYDDVKETRFDFPGLTAGAVTHSSYQLLHHEPRLLTPFYFPGRLPCRTLRFVVSVPESIELKYQVRNDPAGKFVLRTTRKKGNIIYEWTMNNAENAADFSDAPDDLYFLPHIIVHVASYTNSTGKHRLLSNLDDLYTWNSSFLKNLNQKEDPVLRSITDSVINGKTSATEKASAIYQWVQQHIRYVAFENGLEGFRPRQAAEVCRKRYGDCKDMSSILTQMLRMAGIEAYYTWIGTRDIPYKYTEVPLPLVDNHMICVARMNDQWYFIDGTDPNARIDRPPHHLQGKEALVSIDAQSYKVLEVPIMESTHNQVLDSTFIHFTGAGIAGRSSIYFSGYFGEDLANSLLYRDETGQRDFIKARITRGSNKYILGKYNYQTVDTPNNVIHVDATFELPDIGKKIGGEYYLNLNLEKIFNDQGIDTAKRKVPKELPYQYLVTRNHVLAIPEGFEVGYRPADLHISNPYYQLDITYTVTKENIIATQKLVNKILMLQPEAFPVWNKDIAAIQAHYKEQIVLQKKS